MTPSLDQLVLRDTPFADLMNKRIFNVLLIATPYDAFMLEDDGRVDEQIFNEYTALNLRYPPRFTRVSTEEEALACLADRNFELIIVMPNLAGQDIFIAANHIKERYPQVPIVVLTPFSKEVSRRMAAADLSHIDYVFSWLGNADLLLAIIKLIEDKLNAPYDMASVGVQAILLVEDSIRFYSSALPQLYQIVLEQSKEFSKEALNDHLKMLRMRGRPKIMLARTYEEALQILQNFPDNILGVVSDMSFTREGHKDPLAGYRLGKYVREMNRHIPLILESSDAENVRYAEELGVSFIQKNTKSYPQDLESQVMQNFGFGDFVITDPDTHEELLRIKDLKSLQQSIFQIPDRALRYHLTHYHFSRFFYSRAMFPPAEILKAHDVSQYEDMDEARHFIFNLIVHYRRMKNAGVVAVYQKERFDEYSHFARIGNGSLGGKGRGLAFMNTLVKRTPLPSGETFRVNMPKTVVVCTDVFDEFMESNGLYPIALSDASDHEIWQAFERAALPQKLLDDLLSLFKVGVNPIAIRSSSLLEDSHYQPFAGIYATYMVPRQADEKVTLGLVRSAIKAVYASVFYRASKDYLTATQNLIDQEKMAVVLQEVVGAPHGHLFYPTLSGVARSFNFYPSGEELPEEGIASIALGLGKQVVDGGVALRFSPAHPRHLMQLGTVEAALRHTQPYFIALDLESAPEGLTEDDAFNLKRVALRDFPRDDRAARFVFSTYDLQNHRLNAGFFPSEGRPVVSFSGLLQSNTFPLAQTIRELLLLGQKEMCRPVEIEFAMQITGEKAEFYLLQIRPIVDNAEDVTVDTDTPTSGHTLVRSASVLGNGHIANLNDIIYVREETFDHLRSREIAAELAELNARYLAEGRGYVLIGPGRWGSSDPFLGIPVGWSQISAARVIVECAMPGRHVDPSQGSHFFQNLTSLGVGYFTLSEADQTAMLDTIWLRAQPAHYEGRFLREVHLSTPLQVYMDGRHGRGIIVLDE